jgi:dihydrofolate reductase
MNSPMSSSSLSPPCLCPEFKMIVALCRGGGIGYEGTLPWPKLERDLRFFSQMTRSSVFPYNSAVVMGRKTWESIPANVCPLPFRDNFVISASYDTDTDTDGVAPKPGVTFIRHLSEIHDHASKYEVVWFIGGASIYEQVLTPTSSSSGAGASASASAGASAMLFPINEILITFVDESYEHDTAFPLMYQYKTTDEWQILRDNPSNRAIWCWTGADDIPEFVSFFTEGARSNHLYRITDVDREIVASITRPADMKAIQERRSPNTIFLSLRKVFEL